MTTRITFLDGTTISTDNRLTVYPDGTFEIHAAQNFLGAHVAAGGAGEQYAALEQQHDHAAVLALGPALGLDDLAVPAEPEALAIPLAPLSRSARCRWRRTMMWAT